MSGGQWGDGNSMLIISLTFSACRETNNITLACTGDYTGKVIHNVSLQQFTHTSILPYKCFRGGP